MVFVRSTWCLLVVVLGTRATVDIRRAGWLDRIVAYHKDNLIKDFDKFAPVKTSVSIRRKPPNFVDSEDWNYDSVMRLLTIIREGEAPLRVKSALRRLLEPTRRIMMSMKESMKVFPSLSKLESNSFYYDIEYYDSDEQPPQPSVPEDEVVILVSNPVEARLPSARISVKLLRDILLARAAGARYMPPTEKSTIPWIPMTKTSKADGGGDGNDGGDDKKEDGKPDGDAKPEGDEANPEGGDGEAPAEGEEAPPEEAPEER